MYSIRHNTVYRIAYDVTHLRAKGDDLVDAQLKKGFLEVFVLAALRTEESYGYKIINDISPYMEISESTLYPILKRLENGGYLVTHTKAYNGRLRKYYRITAAGVAKIRSFMNDISELNRLSEFIRRGDR